MDISAVIISYNSLPFLAGNLDSLKRQNPAFRRIVVIDNQSKDGSRKWLSARKDIEAVLLDQNIGYAAAANLGLSRCDTPLVLVANADIRLDADFTAAVRSQFASHPDTGLLSPLILRFDGRTVDSAGQECSAALYPRERGYGRPVEKVRLAEGAVFSVCGAATVINRKAFTGVVRNDQFYDEDFFMFWEDFDLGWTAADARIPVRFSPEPRVRHFRSATLENRFRRRLSLALARPPRIRYHLVKNRYLTLIKHFRWRLHWRHLPAILARDLVWTGLLTISAPRTIIWLLRAGPLFRRAWRKRRPPPDR